MTPSDLRPDLECRFGRSTSAGALARDAARYVLDVRADSTDSFVTDVVLVVDELASNVVRHAGTPGVLRIWNTVPHIVIRIEVSDENTTGLPMIKADAADAAVTCRGLRIVDQVAQAWGVDYTASGKTVWAELMR